MDVAAGTDESESENEEVSTAREHGDGEEADTKRGENVRDWREKERKEERKKEDDDEAEGLRVDWAGTEEGKRPVERWWI